MLRLIMRNGTGMFQGDDLVRTGLRVFEIDCPDLEQLLKVCEADGKSITLLGIEVFERLAELPKPASPPALPLAVLVPQVMSDPNALKARLKSKWGSKPRLLTWLRWGKKPNGLARIESIAKA